MTAGGRSPGGPGKRALGALVAGALAVPLSPFATAAFGADAEPTMTACPPGQVSSDNFNDVENNLFEVEINCLADYDVSEGKTATTYDPDGFVLRRQMATFLYRVGLQAGVAWDTSDTGFEDLQGVGSVQTDAINALANASIALGQDPEHFVPNGTTTRAQMASFINRLQDLIDGAGSDGFETTDDFFTDDEQSVHEDNINAIAAAGITVGRGNGQYQPHLNVTRQQMAGYLGRYLNILVEDGQVESAYPDMVEPAVAVDQDEVQQGEDITGTITAGDNVASIAVTGCGFNSEAVTPAEDGTFTLTVPEDAMAEECTLAFTFTFDNGRQQVLEETITVTPAPTTNQTFTVTPSDEATDTTVVAGDEQDSSDDRQYTVSGLDDSATYNIALFPAENVTVTDGTVTFADDNDDDVADGAGVTNAEITVINGAQNTDDQTTVSSVNGEIVFTLDFDGTGTEEVVPAVWLDAEATGDKNLDLDADNAPSEDFGVGGQQNWVPDEATFGFHDDAIVSNVDLDADWFIADDVGHDPETFFYGSDDAFISEGGTSLTMAQFETALSEGDDLDIQYNSDGSSTFTYNDDAPQAVENLTATSADTDDDGSTDDVALDWDAASGAQFDATDYDVERAAVANDGTVGTYVQVLPTVTVTEFEDENLASGTYSYRIETNDGAGNTATSTAVEVVVPEGADAAAPFATAYTVTDTDGAGGTDGILNDGDQITVTLNEGVTFADGDTIDIADDDSGDNVFGAGDTSARLTLGGNTSWTQSSNGEFLFLTLDANPTLLTPGGDNVVDEVDWHLVDVGGSPSDDAGNGFSVEKSLQEIHGTDQFAPLMDDARVDDADDSDTFTEDDVITLTFNESMDIADGDQIDIGSQTITLTGTDSNTADEAMWEQDRNVVTLTLNADTTGPVAIPANAALNTGLGAATDFDDEVAVNDWDVVNSDDVAVDEE